MQKAKEVLAFVSLMAGAFLVWFRAYLIGFSDSF